ncbi:helix-turn-helix domain-containing protein [Sphingobacterium athyrii]|uniref:AraC family transcriptional regulator n=1 Tax=Sphingobacterium athyrii TaxID=2152717 RepID=A0A363NMB2_9SPHI|nr:AraC family transcriptional regulator [Sphingobacterium athyrii]PUV21857.1 AraC family transcriptional regulator [Sphingobacterium athyrii]
MQENQHEILKRGTEITQRYFEFLNQHIDDVASGRVIAFMEINEIASALFLSHTHLTDTIQKETGNHPCYFYDLKIIDRAKELLLSSAIPIAEIARILTYDPSNFSKFFKKFVGKTPGQYRKNLKNKEV